MISRKNGKNVKTEVMSSSDIIAEEKSALDALIRIFEKSGDPAALLIHEDALNYSVLDVSWNDHFRDFKADFLAAIRNVLRITRANNSFKLFCRKESVKVACRDFYGAFSRISKVAPRLAECWEPAPERTNDHEIKNDAFLQELSESFGRMLFSQSYLVFEFGVKDI